MNLCPTCRLPTVAHYAEAHCTVPALPLRRVLAMAADYRLALQVTPLEYTAKAEMLAQVDEQIAFLEGLYG